MTLYELEKLRTFKGWSRFIYLSENQPDYKAADPIKADLEFTNMAIGYTPGQYYLFFRNGLTWLRIDMIERVNCKPCVLGDILEIQCKKSKCFTVIAQ